MVSLFNVASFIGILVAVYLSNEQILKWFGLNKSNIHSEMTSKRVDNFSLYQDRCPRHRYRTRIIERNPLIIYIEQFLTPFEIDHLVELSMNKFERSKLVNEHGSIAVDDYRVSSSAILKRQQTPVVECIERRFSEFQGFISLETMEPLQIVRYFDDEQIGAHFDWYWNENKYDNGGRRMTSFFTYIRSNCSTGGETEFVELQFREPNHRRFCDIITCDEHSSKRGLRFRPIPGNSIFWFNIQLDGDVDHLTYHAGLPPGKNCVKYGMNTWTREDIYQ